MICEQLRFSSGIRNGEWGMGSGMKPFELFPMREESILYSLFPIPYSPFPIPLLVCLAYTLALLYQDLITLT